MELKKSQWRLTWGWVKKDNCFIFCVNYSFKVILNKTWYELPGWRRWAPFFCLTASLWKMGVLNDSCALGGFMKAQRQIDASYLSSQTCVYVCVCVCEREMRVTNFKRKGKLKSTAFHLSFFLVSLAFPTLPAERLRLTPILQRRKAKGFHSDSVQ